MRSTHEIVIDAPVGEVWRALCDPDRLLGLLPGTSLVRDGDTATGSLRLRLGSVQVTYRLTARVTGRDETDHSAGVSVTGKEARGGGTLDGEVQVELRDVTGTTALTVVADVEATGRAETVTTKQWERAVGQLAGTLAGLVADAAPVAEPAGSVAQAAAPAPVTPLVPDPAPPPPPPPLAAAAAPAPPAPREERGGAVRRYGPAALAALLALTFLVRRSRRRTRLRGRRRRA